MKPVFYRIKNSIYHRISQLIKENIRYLVFFFVVFLVGCLVGIFTASKYAADLEPSNLINEYLYSLLTKDMSTITYFLVLSVYFLLINLFVIFLTKNRLMIVIDALLLFFLAYIWGFDICVIFVCLGLAGIILGFICNVLLGLVLFIDICLIWAVVARAIKCERKTYYKQNEYAKLYTFLLLLGIIILFLISFVFALVHIFVIVG